MVLSDSLVKYESNTLSLEHGTVTVATTRGMSIRAGEVNVGPAKPNTQTQYDVRDVNGIVEIKAREGDLRVSSRKTRGGDLAGRCLLRAVPSWTLVPLS